MRPNFLFIMTDTQNCSMVGTYGISAVDTPNLDRLAREGIRFNRAYTACPLCTPARSAIFSGMYPQVNGAWTNNTAPSTAVPLMGTIFSYYDYRTAYVGKWHLDGTAYFGDGQPGGGFEPDWWYDGKRYAESLGPELFERYRTCRRVSDLREGGFTEERIWGHRVADRACEFLEEIGSEPFVVVVSFDEPHAPSVAPPEFWEKFSPEDIPRPANYNAPLKGKPRLQQIQRQQRGEVEWTKTAGELTRLFGCNSYIDREIGRVLVALSERQRETTVVVYTSDHGDMMGAHGLEKKGPMMYEEICRVPFIVRLPGGLEDKTTSSLVCHMDIIPTMLDLAGVEAPEALSGTSLVPLLHDPDKGVREYAMISFQRFAINQDSEGEFYPIRCVTDGRYKLTVNLLDSDEFYDLETDPLEIKNLIDDPGLAEVRDRLHDWLLAEMDRIRDPFRSFRWGDRPWRSVRKQFYFGGESRSRPAGFPFQPGSIEPDGTRSGEKTG
ncbi:MAG TPA: sulfatase-like hydrolase/transferase [Spirochaetia bacterium]|nr:sulfatase-like hydrolase/transferase [Spirochaetia bacterium]